MSEQTSARAAASAPQAVRVSPDTYRALREMAAETGQPIVRCLDDVVQEAYRRRLWLRYAEANCRRQADANALAEWREEEAIWSAAGADALDPDEGVPWCDDLRDAASW